MSASTPTTAPEQGGHDGRGQLVHVVAGVLYEDRRDAVLLARRPHGVHQGGLWEFPGGKLESDEPVEQGLRRELEEELGVAAEELRPLIRLRHDYPDLSVVLDVWKVKSYRGQPRGREGQSLAWVPVPRLSEYPLPAADRPVVAALRLADRYLITPQPGGEGERLLCEVRTALEAGIRLVQLRAPSRSRESYRRTARTCLDLCRAFGAQLLLHADAELTLEVGAHGVHLPAAAVRTLRERPLPEGLWVAASCHDRSELEAAVRLGADFAVLSPVGPTTSHPGRPPLGWPRFAELVQDLPLPVYALGGMRPTDLEQAWRSGAQGIAAIRGLWPAGA